MASPGYNEELLGTRVSAMIHLFLCLPSLHVCVALCVLCVCVCMCACSPDMLLFVSLLDPRPIARLGTRFIF